uniref:DUF4406 domain-containing protein n=1 Tax=viral metagenome TaxID=1070528 RepID=A0A6M3KBR3_9ZZZZ
MKVIYVAGPYRAETSYGVYQNIRKAEAKAVELWQQGYAVLCPHLNSQLFELMFNNANEICLKGGLVILERCDAIYMMKGWESSVGSRAELKVAKKNRMEIIYEEE